MSIKLVNDAPEQRIKNTGMKFLQAPILINHCTTVHKLQGKTIANLLITSWHYASNWVYVALSRMKSLEGLFLQKKLDRTQSLRPNEKIQQMLQQMRSKEPTPYNLQ
jgi:ATP-dependent exoDNAse (exonuclease V) alpha subunit